MQVDPRARRVVEDPGGRQDSPAVPTIAELIQSHMDFTGASLSELSRRSGRVSTQNLSKIVKGQQKEFPEPRTIAALSDLLQVPVTTIVLACAAMLGLPVRQTGSALEIMLPPGTDTLTPEDREAVRAITRALINARVESARNLPADEPDPVPDYDTAEGLRLAPEEAPAKRPANGPPSPR